ncbi:MAG: hypothetical protein IBX71_05125 [Candidatus Desulforudis sp.]|nr:hypothetical protein [Desulforudis sp.]
MSQRGRLIVLFIVVLLVLTAGGCRRGADSLDPAPGPVTPEVGETEPLRVPDAERGEWGHYALARMPEMPPCFRVAGWLDGECLVGLSRDRVTVYNPFTRYTATVGETAWNVWPAPDGHRVAYNNEKGIYVVDVDTGTNTLVVRNAPGETSGPADFIWAPDGRRFLFSYAYEWDSGFFIHEFARDLTLELGTGMESYFLKQAVAWPDPAMILFTVRAAVTKDGTMEYGEGYRADFAVYNTADDSFKRITDLEDGRFITYEGPAPAGRFAYLIRDREGRAAETGLIDLNGVMLNRRTVDYSISGLVASKTGGTTFYLQDVKRDGPGGITRLLIEHDGALLPVVEISHDAAFVQYRRSDDGRKLAFTFSSPMSRDGTDNGCFGYLLLDRSR